MDEQGGTSQSASERATFEIENGAHQLETLLESQIDKNYDKMEIYALRNMLAIPDGLSPWIKLRHYEVCQRRVAIAHC
jgi:kinetochore protein Mis12/MTW1